MKTYRFILEHTLSDVNGNALRMSKDIFAADAKNCLLVESVGLIDAIREVAAYLKEFGDVDYFSEFGNNEFNEDQKCCYYKVLRNSIKYTYRADIKKIA